MKDLKHLSTLEPKIKCNEEFLEGLNLWDGKGNGTPLQYSCLENPMDGGAW